MFGIGSLLNRVIREIRGQRDPGFDSRSESCLALGHRGVVVVNLTRAAPQGDRSPSGRCAASREELRQRDGVRNHLRRRTRLWIVAGSAVPDTDAGTTPVPALLVRRRRASSGNRALLPVDYLAVG